MLDCKVEINFIVLCLRCRKSNSIELVRIELLDQLMGVERRVPFGIYLFIFIYMMNNKFTLLYI